MTRPSLTEAYDAHDVTIALTPTQLALLAIGAFLLLRFLRGLRR
ncbi:MAG TPA: hypothetical protein VI277_02245 [Candidatus Limnocylindria bacterium]